MMRSRGSAGTRIDIFLRDDRTSGAVDSIRKGIIGPDGIFIDTSGVLYVANTACVAHGSKGCHTKVTVYARGGHEPLRAYTGGIAVFATSSPAF